MTNKFLPGDVELRKRIKSHIREDKVVENNLRHEVDVLYFLQTDPSVVTSRIRKSISDHLGMAALKKVRSSNYSQLVKRTIVKIDNESLNFIDQSHQGTRRGPEITLKVQK